MYAFKEVDVVCPYFKGFLNSTTIKCECPAQGFYSVLQKKNKSQIAAYMKRNCNTFNYIKCPYAELLEREVLKNG